MRELIQKGVMIPDGETDWHTYGWVETNTDSTSLSPENSDGYDFEAGSLPGSNTKYQSCYSALSLYHGHFFQ